MCVRWGWTGGVMIWQLAALPICHTKFEKLPPGACRLPKDVVVACGAVFYLSTELPVSTSRYDL